MSDYVYMVLDEQGQFFGFDTKYRLVNWISHAADYPPDVVFRSRANSQQPATDITEEIMSRYD